jgi:hypothetical protein
LHGAPKTPRITAVVGNFCAGVIWREPTQKFVSVLIIDFWPGNRSDRSYQIAAAIDSQHVLDKMSTRLTIPGIS